MRVAQVKAPLLIKDVLDAAVRAYEVMAASPRPMVHHPHGIDHVVLIKIGATALATKLLGGTREDVLHALSNAWIDGHTLTLFRGGPESGARKSWAAGDAAARGVWLARMALRGEWGTPRRSPRRPGGFTMVF